MGQILLVNEVEQIAEAIRQMLPGETIQRIGALPTTAEAVASDLIVIGRHVDQPLQLAASLQAQHNKLPVLILTRSEDHARLAREINLTPGLGPWAHVHSAEDSELGTIIRRILDDARGARRYTTILSDVSAGLAHRSPVIAPQAYLEKLLSHAPLGIVAVSLETSHVLAANAAAAAILGVSLRELQNASMPAVFESAAARISNILEESLRRESVRSTVICERDGAIKHLQITATSVPAESSRAAIMMLEDITDKVRAATERERAHVALDRQRREIQAILDHSPAAIFVKDVSGSYTVVNQAFENQFGCSGPDLLGKSDYEVFPEAVARILDRQHQHVIAKRRALQDALNIPASDGERTFMAVHFPISDSGGDLTGVAAILSEVTEQRKMEAKMREAQKLESLGVLAGGIAHDFNNLLTSVIGNASLVLDAMELNDPRQQALRDVVGGGKRAAELTRQLLAYAGKGSFFLERVDLSQVVIQTGKLVHSSIAPNVQVRMDLDKHLPLLLADPGQIQQIVMNLIINAAEAIGENGGIVQIRSGRQTVRAEPLPDMFLKESLTPGEYIFLEVQDNGSGMDEPTMQRIFDPFFTTKFTGRGLGLAAVLGIVRQHKGGIQLRSVPGRGTSFRVLLCVEGEAPPPAAKREPEDLRG